MIGHLRDEIENLRKTSFSDLFSDGKPAEISRDFEPTAPLFSLSALFYISPASARDNKNLIRRQNHFFGELLYFDIAGEQSECYFGSNDSFCTFSAINQQPLVRLT